jgi:DNA-binding response OmpR family regulator
MQHMVTPWFQIDRRSWLAALSSLVVFSLCLLGPVWEASAAVVFPSGDRSMAVQVPADAGVWAIEEGASALILPEPSVLSWPTTLGDVVQSLTTAYHDLTGMTWSSLFEVNQGAQRFTFSLVFQAEPGYGPIRLSVGDVNLTNGSPVVPVAPSPSSALLFVPALVGLLGVLSREQHRVTAPASDGESMVGSSLSGNVPCLLILSADTVFSKIIHAQVSQAGYPARVAGAVSDALTISEHALPALLLVDRRIPDWDMLRTSPLLKSVPLFALAPAEGLYTEEQWVSDLERGADSIYDFRDGDRLFLAKLRASLWRAGYAVTGRAVYQVGAVHLDADHHEVTIAGQQLPLSAKPFAILKTLMEAPSRVFSRSELVDRVWGPQFAIGEHTLDVHVHALRRQLDRAPERLCRLITIKGVGFKLKADDSVLPSLTSTTTRSTRSISGDRAEEFVTTAGFTSGNFEINRPCQSPSPQAVAFRRGTRRRPSRMSRRSMAVPEFGPAVLAG